MSVFKVWSSDRNKRVCFICQCTVDLVIANANLKLGINGIHLCLECDGTEIDSDEVLEIFRKEIFILLDENESWVQGSSSTNFNFPIPSTSTNQEEINGIDNNGSIDHEANIENVRADGFNDVTGAVEQNGQNPFHDNVHRVDPNAVQEINVNVWQNYEYDWTNLDRKHIQKLEERSTDKRIKQEVVHKVIDQMRDISTTIPCVVLRNVSQKIVAKYPDTFEDRKNGKRFSRGYNNLYHSLLSRNNYVISLLKSTIPRQVKRTSGCLRFLTQAKLGSLNWKVNDYPENETEETLTQKKRKFNRNIFFNC